MTVQQRELQQLQQDVGSIISVLLYYHTYIALPPSSVSVSPVQDVYAVGDTVTLTCTVVATVPDSRNTAYIRWRRNNNIIKDTEISPTTVDGIHSINYTYPLTINTISLSDAGQYSCRANIRSTGIPNVLVSTTVTQDTVINISCK